MVSLAIRIPNSVTAPLHPGLDAARANAERQALIDAAFARMLNNGGEGAASARTADYREGDGGPLETAEKSENNKVDPREKKYFHEDEYWACVGNKVLAEHFVPYAIGLGLVYGGPHPVLKLIGGIGAVALGAQDALYCRNQATHIIRR